MIVLLNKSGGELFNTLFENIISFVFSALKLELDQERADRLSLGNELESKNREGAYSIAFSHFRQ